jgi:hypothetical protein
MYLVDGKARVRAPVNRFQPAWITLMHLYAGEEELDHQRYYDREAVLELSRELFQLEVARTFLLGFNQLFSLLKT